MGLPEEGRRVPAVRSSRRGLASAGLFRWRGRPAGDDDPRLPVFAHIEGSDHRQPERTEDTVQNSLKDTLRSDLDGARRARDRERTLVLSTALADVRNREIEAKALLDDEGVRGVLARAVKQRLDAAEQMRDGGRPELAEREEAQARILRAYLPAELSAGEVRGMVREIVAAGAGDIGAVMSALMPRIRGRFEGRAASAIVREELGGR